MKQTYYKKIARQGNIKKHRCKRCPPCPPTNIRSIALAVSALRRTQSTLRFPRRAPRTTGQEIIRNFKSRTGVNLYNNEKTLQRSLGQIYSSGMRYGSRALVGYALRHLRNR